METLLATDETEKYTDVRVILPHLKQNISRDNLTIKGFLHPYGPVFDNTKPTLKTLCGIVRVIND